MTDVEKFKRHINEPHHFTIGEDTFAIRPLDVRFISHLVTAFSVYDKIASQVSYDISSQEDMEQAWGDADLTQVFTEEVTNACKVVVYESIRQSYSELDDEVITQFASDNFWTILGEVFLVNAIHNASGERQSMQELKQKLEELRNTKDANVQGSTTKEKETNQGG